MWKHPCGALLWYSTKSHPGPKWFGYPQGVTEAGVAVEIGFHVDTLEEALAQLATVTAARPAPLLCYCGEKVLQAADEPKPIGLWTDLMGRRHAADGCDPCRERLCVTCGSPVTEHGCACGASPEPPAAARPVSLTTAEHADCTQRECIPSHAPMSSGDYRLTLDRCPAYLSITPCSRCGSRDNPLTDGLCWRCLAARRAPEPSIGAPEVWADVDAPASPAPASLRDEGGHAKCTAAWCAVADRALAECEKKVRP